MRRRTSATLMVPVGDAFEFVADPRHRPLWQRGLRRVEMLDEGPPRVGMRWIDVTSVGARPRMTIVALDPGREWAEHGRWRGVEATVALRFRADGAATAVDVEVTLRWDTGWLPLSVVLLAVAPPAVRADLRRAGRLLAAGRH